MSVNIFATWVLRANIGSWNIYSKSYYFCIPQAKREQFARRQKQIRYSRRNPHRSHSTLHPTQTNYASLLLARIRCTQECSLRSRPPAASPTLDLSFHCAHIRAPLPLSTPAYAQPWTKRKDAALKRVLTWLSSLSSGGSIRLGPPPPQPPIGRPSILVDCMLGAFWCHGGQRPPGDPFFGDAGRGINMHPLSRLRFCRREQGGERTDGRAGGRAPPLLGSLAPHSCGRTAPSSSRLASSEAKTDAWTTSSSSSTESRHLHGDGFIALIYVPVGPTCRYRRKTRTHFHSLPFWFSSD